MTIFIMAAAPSANNEYIPLETAKESIVAALARFHPSLGYRAADILYNDNRLNLVEEPAAKTGMMQCRPAGLDRAYLEQNNMLIPDFRERFGPRFTEQENNKPYAIIDYEYTGTPQSVLYLAHELGHALADDIQNENGRSFRDFTADEAEKQAYFIQNIYSHYAGIAAQEDMSREKSDIRLSWERVTQYDYAKQLFQSALALPDAERSAAAIRALSEKFATDNIQTPYLTVTPAQAPR